MSDETATSATRTTSTTSIKCTNCATEGRESHRARIARRAASGALALAALVAAAGSAAFVPSGARALSVSVIEGALLDSPIRRQEQTSGNDLNNFPSITGQAVDWTLIQTNIGGAAQTVAAATATVLGTTFSARKDFGAHSSAADQQPLMIYITDVDRVHNLGGSLLEFTTRGEARFTDGT